MTNSLRWYPGFFVGAACFGFAACSTQEISADPALIPETTPSPNNGALMITFAPSEATFEEQQANAAAHTSAFYVFVDGKQLAWPSDAGGSLQPVAVGEGGATGVGYLLAGSHHFEIRTAGSRTTLFAGDGQIAAGSTTELYLFGVSGAVQGRFVSYPSVAPPGTAHVVLINLIRTGQAVEMVTCVDESHCTPLSSPLALGDAFQADVPMDATQNWPNGRYIVSNGAALGYRQVPTAAVSDPRELPLTRGFPAPSDGSTAPSAVLVGAPIYMSPTGDIQASF